MIECPICHVTNEELSRFCAECGQRLTVTSAPALDINHLQPSPSTLVKPPLSPATTEASNTLLSTESSQNSPPASNINPIPPRVSLHSPLLGSSDPEEMAEPKPDTSRRSLHSPLLGSSAPEEIAKPKPDTSRRSLHSPLLGSSDPEEIARPKPDTSRRSLHSPLLGSSDPEEIARPKPDTSRRSLHSPLLGSSDPEEITEPEPGTSRHFLHSPLLGWQDFPKKEEYPGSPKRSSLHSPLLDDTATLDTPRRQRSFPADEKPHLPDHEPTGSRGLHSPLLGRDDTIPNQERPHSEHRSGLHSPLLGDSTDEEHPAKRKSSLFGKDKKSAHWVEPIEIVEETNVLRSPLLAAKVPLSDKPLTEATPTTEKAPSQAQEPPQVIEPARPLANKPSPLSPPTLPEPPAPHLLPKYGGNTPVEPVLEHTIRKTSLPEPIDFQFDKVPAPNPRTRPALERTDTKTSTSLVSPPTKSSSASFKAATFFLPFLFLALLYEMWQISGLLANLNAVAEHVVWLIVIVTQLYILTNWSKH